MRTDSSITLNNVSKRYGRRIVLDDVSCTFSRGETVAIIGPSGGGKSTLLRCINGLVEFDSGEIRIGPYCLRAGTNTISSLGPVRRQFGMIFQDFQLFPHLTALENIMESPRQVLGQTTEAAEQNARTLLARVGLADRADAIPHQLSGGQKQRIAIARALAMAPRGLLCDEISSALDPELKHEVLDVLEKLKVDGMTLILVTHEIGFARRAADRILVLADGRIIESGPPEQVLERPREERTKEFLRRVIL